MVRSTTEQVEITMLSGWDLRTRTYDFVHFTVLTGQRAGRSVIEFAVNFRDQFEPDTRVHDVEAAHVEALEHAEIVDFEQNFFDGMVSSGSDPKYAREIVEGLRDVDSPWGVPSAETNRYDELVRKHAGTVLIAIRHQGQGI